MNYVKPTEGSFGSTEDGSIMETLENSAVVLLQGDLNLELGLRSLTGYPVHVIEYAPTQEAVSKVKPWFEYHRVSKLKDIQFPYLKEAFLVVIRECVMTNGLDIMDDIMYLSFKNRIKIRVVLVGDECKSFKALKSYTVDVIHLHRNKPSVLEYRYISTSTTISTGILKVKGPFKGTS